MSNAKKLWDIKCEAFREVFITPDLSIKERNAQKELRAELKRRKDAGEAHLKIIRGKIIKNNTDKIKILLKHLWPLMWSPPKTKL